MASWAQSNRQTYFVETVYRTLHKMAGMYYPTSFMLFDKKNMIGICFKKSIA